MDTKPFKIGRVSVAPAGESEWLLRYRDPGTGRDVRRKLRGVERRDAENAAVHISGEILAEGGYVPGEKPRAPEIGEAIADAIRLRNTQPETIRERSRRSLAFVRWLRKRHPAVTTWDQLKPAMVQAYVIEREQEGRAFDTVRLDLAPIKIAWAYVSENWPELVRPLPKIRLATAPKPEIECLAAGEVAILIDWLREHKPELWPMACLQGLAGLRVLEAASLRIQDVDFKGKTVAIVETDRHKPKNRFSVRVIPVCDEVLESMRITAANQRVKPAGGDLFADAKGDPWKRTALGHRWTYTLRKAARKTGIRRFSEVPSRKLRASFATMASRMGANDRILRAYLGHSPTDIMGAHYRRIDAGELRAVSVLMNGWRDAAECESGKKLASR